jgi:hypothetical protein
MCENGIENSTVQYRDSVMCMFLNFFKTGYVELNGRMVVNEELERM